MIKLSVCKLNYFTTSLVSKIFLVRSHCSDCINIFDSPFFDLRNAASDDIEKFINSIDNVVTDCDGVLWNKSGAIPGSVDALNYLRKIGKRIFFCTNSTQKTREGLAKKACGLGFVVSPDEVYLPSYFVVQYLRTVGFDKIVYLVAPKSYGKELDAARIKHIGIGPDSSKSVKAADLENGVGAVAVGMDKHFNFMKIMKAASYLNSDCCHLLSGNGETRVRPSEAGIVKPGVGVLTGVIEKASNRKAEVLGKPAPFVVNYFTRNMKLNPYRTLMVGDSIHTDIEFGVRCGFKTLLVLSGNVTQEEMETKRTDNTPPLADMVLPTLGDILDLIPSYKSLDAKRKSK